MSGPETVTRAGQVAGQHTDLLISRYADKLLICVTQLKKFGSWVQLERAVVKPGESENCSASRHVYNCSVLLGQDTEELHFLGRALAEKIDTSKPVILAVGIKNLTVPLALELVKFVSQHL